MFESTKPWALLLLCAPLAAQAQPSSRCDEVLRALGERVADARCFESPDLTTRNESLAPTGPTTPMNNSLVGPPVLAFTPRTDRETIAPVPADRTPITKVVPGVQVEARIAQDPTGEGRFLLRVPNDWNGRLVVAGASGTRSEFNGDFAWSDYVVQQGYAYASQNKGIFNLRLSTPAEPLACRLNPASTLWVQFYDNDPQSPFTRWAPYMAKAAMLARRGLAALGGEPERTYAVGTSNGGYQVRRAVESYPHLFDGGVDWEGTFVSAAAPNILTDLPPAILNYPDYVKSGFDAGSTAAKNIRAAGYPPDLVVGGKSFWGNYWGSFWEVTQCQWQKRIDPGYDTYGSGTGTYNYVARLSASDAAAQLAAFATTGRIKRPLITVAGTMDALLPIEHHARAYARAVAAAQAEATSGEGDEQGESENENGFPAYRLYEVQNGNHIETYKATFPQLELIQRHAQRAFDLLVKAVEQGASLPPSQCVPRGGDIAAAPSQPGHCAQLLVP
ncbi:MAG: tannase/feruloyl esterase family alpha/beta hydrolase [Myxococcales bacterium]